MLLLLYMFLRSSNFIQERKDEDASMRSRKKRKRSRKGKRPVEADG
jgi:hypothetical protein